MALATEILANASDSQKEVIAQRAKKSANEAFEESKAFLAKKDSAKALEAIDKALANVANDELFLSHRRKVEALVQEEQRVEKVALKKAAFDEYMKDANENLALATDVSKAGFLEISLQKLQDAKFLKLEEPSLYNPDEPKSSDELKGMIASMTELQGKVLARQEDLKTRKLFDDRIFEATKLLTENSDMDGKLAGIDDGLAKVEEALKIAAAKKVVTEAEGKQPEELKAKLAAKRTEVVAREQKRSDIADLLKNGDAAFAAFKYKEALDLYKKAEPMVGDLTGPEKEAVAKKIQVGVDGAENFKKVNGMILSADKLSTEERFEDALKTIDEASKVLVIPTLAQKKAEYEKRQSELKTIVAQAYEAASADLKAKKLDAAADGLKSVADKHPGRAELTGPAKGLADIQNMDKAIAAKISEFNARIKVFDDQLQSTSDVKSPVRSLGKLTATAVDRVAKEGVAKAPDEAKDLSGRMELYTRGAEDALRAIQAKIEANKPKAAPPVEAKPKGGQGEQEIKLD